MPPEEATDAEIDRQIKTLLSHQTYLKTQRRSAPLKRRCHFADVENIEGAAHMAGEGTITLTAPDSGRVPEGAHWHEAR